MMDFQSVIFRTDWKSILRRITETISGQILSGRFLGRRRQKDPPDESKRAGEEWAVQKVEQTAETGH